MAIEWVQGFTAQGSEDGPGDPFTTEISGLTAGNCLIVSIGHRRGGSLGSFNLFLTDTANNVWLPPITSSVQIITGGATEFQLYTFVAVNIAGGTTTITFNGTDGGCAIAIDEYSGVEALYPIDQSSFGSTPYASGLTSIASGQIGATNGELVYTAAYGMEENLVFTGSAGFTEREYVTGSVGAPISLQSWDQQSTGGNYQNNVSVNTDPLTLHVNILGLSATTIERSMVQLGAFAESGVSLTEIDVPFPYPNTAGNLLVAVGFMYERTDAVIIDTLGNSWIVVYNDPDDLDDTVVVAYCLNCLAGQNTVTLNTLGGGDDGTLMMIVEEITPVQSFNASSKNAQLYQESISTGNISVANNSFLVSMYSGSSVDNENLSAPGPVSQLGVVRYQFSTAGFISEFPRELAIADQVASTAGSYNNLFSIAPNSAVLAAAILGFNDVPPNCFLVDFPLSGPYYDANGQPLANGSLSIRLVFDCNCPCADYQITGNNHSFIQLDENGSVLGNPQVRPNDQLAPSGSYYILQGYSNSGQLVYGPKVVTVLST